MKIEEGFYFYEIPPIDYGWESLPTVGDYYKLLIEEHQDFSVGIALERIELTESFVRKALKYGKENGWGGEFSEEPRIFSVPSDNETVSGIMWKLNNNGITLVASPIDLPWLHSLEES